MDFDIRYYNKAITALVTPLLTWLLTSYTTMPEETQIALITGLTGVLVYFIPNKTKSSK